MDTEWLFWICPSMGRLFLDTELSSASVLDATMLVKASCALSVVVAELANNDWSFVTGGASGSELAAAGEPSSVAVPANVSHCVTPSSACLLVR